MRIKITSDGTAHNTRIVAVDEKASTAIDITEHVQTITWSLAATNHKTHQLADVTLGLLLVDVDVEGDAHRLYADVLATHPTVHVVERIEPSESHISE